MMMIPPLDKDLLIRVRGIDSYAIKTTKSISGGSAKKTVVGPSGSFEGDVEPLYNIERGYVNCKLPGFSKSFWRSGSYRGIDCKVSACVLKNQKTDNLKPGIHKIIIEESVCTKPEERSEFKLNGQMRMRKYEKMHEFDKAQLFALE